MRKQEQILTTRLGSADMTNNEMSSSTSTILVIEDDKDQATFIRMVLHECNWVQSIEIVHDGEEALNLLTVSNDLNQSFDGRTLLFLPRLIILDLQLPNAHGLEVLKRIKGQSLTKHIPVIVLTGSYISGDLKKSYDLGALSFLRKPIDPSALIQAVEHCFTAQ
jgi:two-component system response regulator